MKVIYFLDIHIIIQELENLNIIEKPVPEQREKILDIKSKKDEMTAKLIDSLLSKYNLTLESAAKLFELSKYHTYSHQQIRANAETQTTVMLRLTNAKKSKNVIHITSTVLKYLQMKIHLAM